MTLGALGAIYLAGPKGIWIGTWQRSAGLVRHTARRLRRTASHLGSEGVGLAERAAHRTPAPPADDATLLDRVESELFADPLMPKGRINLEVDRGLVVLRGELDTEAEIGRVVEATRRMAGVHDVRSHLHLRGTPAPNKAAALAAGATTADAATVGASPA